MIYKSENFETYFVNKNKNLMEQIKSWKTTIIGVILMTGAIILYVLDKPIEASMCLANSIGFFMAKDYSVTGVGKSAITESEIETLQKRNLN